MNILRTYFFTKIILCWLVYSSATWTSNIFVRCMNILWKISIFHHDIARSSSEVEHQHPTRKTARGKLPQGSCLECIVKDNTTHKRTNEPTTLYHLVRTCEQIWERDRERERVFVGVHVCMLVCTYQYVHEYIPEEERDRERESMMQSREDASD